MAANIPLILVGTFLNRLAGFGGGFFDSQGNPILNSPEAIAALEHLIAELPYALPDPTLVAFDEMLEPWFSGQIAMTEFWADLGKMSDNPDQSTIPHQWGVVPLPKGPAPKGRVTAPLNAGWSLGVSSAAQNEEIALAFLRFCLQPEIHLRICIAGGLDPVRYSTYREAAYRQYASEELACAAQDAILSAPVSWPTVACWPSLQISLHEKLVQALHHVTGPRQALEDAQNAWIQIMRSSKN
jgi:multiple sugar transport system substrate-binding protein